MKFFKLKRLSDVLYFIMMVVIFLIPSIQVLAATSIGGCETNTTKGGVQCSWDEHKSWSAINTTACVQEATCATTVSSTATVWCATPLSMSVCVCQTGYFNCSTSGDCTYRHTTDHCALYDNCTGLCTRCDPGYQLTTDKLCVGAILKLGPGSVSGSSVIQGSDTSSTMFISGDSVTIGTSTGADIYIVGASTLGNLRMINNKSIKVDSNSANTTLLIGNYGDGQGFGYGASTTYTASLAVEGDVKANQLCIKESCRGTWADIEGINYWTASGDNIYNNNTGNVGIGDTGPTNKLSVNGDIAGSGTLKISNSSGLSYVMGNLSVGGSGGFSGITLSRYLDIIGGDYVGEVLRSTDVSSIILSAQNGTPAGADFGYRGKQMVVGTINNYPINFIANGTSKMFINSSGNVGIGTTNPQTSLDVIGGSRFYAPGGGRYFWITPSSNNQEIGTSGGQLNLVPANGSILIYSGKNDTTLTMRDSHDSDTIRLNSHGDSFFVGGNVGIGTTKPVAKLQIDPFWFSNPNETDTINLAQSGFANISVAPQAMITMNSGDHHPGAAIGLALHNANSAPGAYAPLLVFSKKEILGEGKGFNSAIAAIGAQTLEGTGVNEMWVDGDLMFYTAPSGGYGLVERMRITQGGDVGIGTTNPDAKLDVSGSLAVSGAVSFTGPLYIGGNNRLLMVDNSGTVTATSTQAGVSMPSGSAGQTLRYGSSGWEATNSIYVKDGGDVGIGTTSPDAKLDVNGSLAVRGAVQFALYTGGGSRLLMVDDAGNVSATSTTVAGGDYVLKGGDMMTGTLRFETSTVGVAIDAGDNNITAVRKLSVVIIDPLYDIGGVKYSSYAPSIVGGVKEEYVGRGNIKDCSSEFCSWILDFSQVSKGSDLWVWRQIIDFHPETIEVIMTAYGKPALLSYEIGDNQIKFYSDRPTQFSYRLVGSRFDWRRWPTLAPDQSESTSLIIK